MKLINVAAAVVNQTPLDWDGNLHNILAAINEARSQCVSIVCFPELCIPGYGCEDAYHGRGVPEMSARMLGQIVQATRGMVVSVGLPVFYHNALFNAACLIADGRILGFVAKRYLAGDGIHYEPRWFKPWGDEARAEISLDGETFPLGDLYFDVGGVRIGFEICEDAWVGMRPGAELARQGVDIILNPSASHFAFGKLDVRKRFVLEGSRAFNVSYVYANLLGNEAGRAIYDGGAIIASGGKLLACGPRFSFADYRLTTAVIDVDATRTSQARTGSFRPDLAEPPGACVRCDFVYPERRPEPAPTAGRSWEESAFRKEEEFTRAVSLALFDYMRKSRSYGFVLSLSGGADSSAVACLIRLMVDLHAAELGLAGVVSKLHYIPAFTRVKDTAELMKRMLLCVYQATENSSDATKRAAAAVAGAVGAELAEIDVSGIVCAYVEKIEDVAGRKLSWDTDDIALQNIQARVRGPGAWMLANIRNALLVAPSNRSEAAVGYATMDGDTCGGLSPIAGIDKAFLRRWLKWLETEGPHGLAPIAALSAVTSLVPSAELRPRANEQTDEADLMPYPVLDVIERGLIRDRKLPREILSELVARFPGEEPERLAAYVEKFFRLWCRNQWKRERFAPSFHLDDESLDPKTWCRFPILSGGYEKELAEMREERS